ncbi:MAG: recombination-associated protein RdgC [Corticimicrobacter sp.]|uniref:recombination-associated protein RdgC n=1 Tax=Corticimicrobacter sp. TaxID=2678536 RepID=UPI0032DACD4E
MWFKNLQVYRLPSPWNITAEALEAQLAAHAYQPGSGLEAQRLGWIAPREGGGLVHEVGRQLLIALRAEKKLLPASVVNQVAKARATELEEQQGFKPGRKQMKDLKEQVTDELLPKAFSIHRDTLVWIDPESGWLGVDAAATAKADEVLGLLHKSVSPLPLRPLHVIQSPAAAMTAWLASDEAPSNFSIDQDTELQAAGESKATIRYVKHTLDPEDIRRHIASGKQCTRLALTWADRISFVLTESLSIKRISPLDVLKENAEISGMNDDEIFDADMMLMTGELSKLLADLIYGLGGEQPA